jgi:prevent-host-death family protein
MKIMSAREAKNAFGLMIDTARAEPVLIEKHGRGVVVVIAVEEYERLTVGPSAARRNVDGSPKAKKEEG